MPSTDIRRCRFVDYQPSAINICSWMPISPNSADCRDLAIVVRENKTGRMELWDGSNPEWSLLCSFSPNGVLGKSIEGVAWTLAPHADNNEKETTRLFSIGLDGFVVEWDLERMITKRHADSNGGGAIWCCVASPDFTHLAVGCENGSVGLFRILSQSQRPILKFERSLDIQQGGRVMSIAWSPCGKYISCGSSKGSLSLYKVETGRIEHVMKVEPILVREKTDHVKKEAIIWSLSFTQDGQLVSSDSTGHVSFWSINTGTMTQTFSLSEHDIYTISSCKSSVYAGGADQKVYELKLDEQSKKWHIIGSVRAHINDVRSLSVGRKGLISASVDTTISVYDTSDKLKLRTKFHQQLERDMVKVCGSVMWAVVDSRKVKAWDMSAPSDSAPRQLLSLSLPDAIIEFDVADDVIAILTASSLKIYRVEFVKEEGRVVDVQMAEIRVKVDLGIIRSISLSSSDKLFVGSAVPKSNALFFTLKIEELNDIEQAETSELPVKSIKQITPNKCVLSSQNEIICIEGKKIPQVTSFDYQIDRIQSVNDQIYIISGKIIVPLGLEWSKSVRSELGLIKLNDRIIGCSAFEGSLVAYGHSFILSIPFGSTASSSPTRSSKRRSNQAEQEANQTETEDTRSSQVKLLTGYSGTIFAAGLPDKSLVLVERSWEDIAARFPPVVKRKLFGGYN